MAKVYVFPQKKELPKCIEEGLQKVAKEYVELAYAASQLMFTEPASDEEIQELNDLLLLTYAKGLEKAMIDILEEKL